MAAFSQQLVPPEQVNISRHHVFNKSWPDRILASSSVWSSLWLDRQATGLLLLGGSNEDQHTQLLYQLQPGNPDLLELTLLPTSETPSPVNSSSTPISANDIRTKSRTLVVTPVAITKSSGFSCCRIRYIAST